MKNRNKNIFLLLLIVSMLVFTNMVAASTYFTTKNYTKTETFETDTDDIDPSESWYTYTETGLDWANVDGSVGRGSSSKSYRINDTDGGNISTDISSFTFTARNYTYFSFWFKWDSTNHNRSYGILDSTNGYILDIDFGKDAERIVVSNYSVVAIERSLTNDTWYQLRFDFNYSTNEIRCRLYNTTDLLNDTWIRAESETGYVDFDDFTAFINFASADDKMYLYFDDFETFYQVTFSTKSLSQTNYITSTILPILFAVFVFITFMGLALSGNLNRDSMIILMGMGIIGIICIQVIAAI